MPVSHKFAPSLVLEDIRPAFRKAAKQALKAIESGKPVCAKIGIGLPFLQTYVSVGYRGGKVILETAAFGQLMGKWTHVYHGEVTSLDIEILNGFIAEGPHLVLAGLNHSLLALRRLGCKRRNLVAQAKRV